MNILLCWIVLGVIQKANCIGLTAHFSQNGLHGSLALEESEGKLIVETYFKVLKNISEQKWSWGIHEFPVNYDNVNSDKRCSTHHVGKKLYDLENIFGPFDISDNKTLVREFDISVLNDGLKSFWGRSIVLYQPELDKNICSSLLTNLSDYENIAEARFKKDILGSIIFRSLSSSDGRSSLTLIYTDLGFAPSNNSIRSYKKVTVNAWKIFTTDVFDNSDDVDEVNCNNLQILFDPYNAGVGKSIGDLDVRLGKLQIFPLNPLNKNKQTFVDKDLLLTLNDYSSSTRKLYIVLYDDAVPNKYISCAKIRPINPKVFKAIINGNGLKGSIMWKQKSLFEPTFVNVSIGSVYTNKRSWLEYARDLGNIFISNLPPKQDLVGNLSYCGNYSTGSMFDPIVKLDIPLRGLGTQDEYSVGDLTGKLWNKEINTVRRIFQNSNELNGLYWDLYSPLIGSQSILHRGLVISRKQQNGFEPWSCATILAYDPEMSYKEVKMTTAVVTFKYPIVGQIFFKQPTNAHWEDTTIMVEYLIHADGGSLNTTQNHRWAIHSHIPGKDFYDWQNRCLSAGDIFNPHDLYSNVDGQQTCSEELTIACRTGDLYNIVGMLTISGSRKKNFLSRKLFTLSSLPLGGYNKILGRSVVVYDDFGPKARGERLACSMIEYVLPRKAVVKDWFGNGQVTNIMGKFEFTQQSQYDITNIEQALTGRSFDNIYGIHKVPVAINLEFPCEASSIESIYNPANSNSKMLLNDPGTLDFYELGDLSGKFPNIGASEMKNESFIDNQMTLFGYNSIIGRSIVIRDKQSTKHIACGTIERGYSPRESRESRAIVSFHHPLGFAYGYIRLSQLIGLVSGQSDTSIEVNLRYPGLHDRNKTRNHLFKIYVNAVGVDAIVKQTVTRCTAGGYVWNPFYTQLADPRNEELYRDECSADNPFRCYVGDVSARIGTIDIGYGRQMLTDSNFPLDGAVSSIGRSIVIFGPERSTDIFACANIEPDHDIIKYVNIERPPRFVTAQFLEDVRDVMGIPEWFLEVDSRKTKLLYDNACVQIVIHFRGPIAARLEQDFSKMLIFGRLESPSLYIPGYQNSKRKSTIQHKECSIKDGQKNKLRNKIRGKNPAISSSDRFNRYHLVLCVISCLTFIHFI